MARFVVRAFGGRKRFDPRDTSWEVVDTEQGQRAVSRFPTRDAAEEYAERLNQGPIDLDEQAAWQDEEDEDWGTWERWD